MNALASANSNGTLGSAEEPSHSIALFSEGLIDASEFQALTGIAAEDIPKIIAEPHTLAAVRRLVMKLRNSGTTARLEAIRYAREAVEVAVQVMRSTDMNATNRLNAAAFIAKMSGTDKGPPANDDNRGRHSITINIGGDKAPIVVKQTVSEGGAETD